MIDFKNLFFKLNFVIVLLLFFIFGFGVSAFDFDIQTNLSVKNNYLGGEIVNGTLNITLKNSIKDGMFSSNFEGNISLIEILERNSMERGNDYECNPSSCRKAFSKLNEKNEFLITKGNDYYAGFYFLGQDISVEDVSLTIKSNSLGSCENPLEIDFSDDEIIDLIGGGYLNESCADKNYGCFENSAQTDYASISGDAYCEKIKLGSGGAFRLGARIRNTTLGETTQIKMSLYDLESNSLGECILPPLNFMEQELECSVDYSSKNQSDYLVCVEGDSRPIFDYKIRTENRGAICGTDDFGESYKFDYEIFAYPLKFKGFSENLNEETSRELFGESLSYKIDDYLSEIYDRKCEQGCAVPIYFRGISQSVSFSDVFIKYRSGNTLLQNEKLYELNSSEPKINSNGSILLDVGKFGFRIPFDSQEKKFVLNFENKKIAEKMINVTKGFDFDIEPKNVLIGKNTEFVIKTTENLTSSVWNFGEGNPPLNGINKINYAYIHSGNFSIRIRATGANGFVNEKIINVSVGNANESLTLRLNELEEKLKRISGKTNGLEVWKKNVIERVINLSSANQTLAAVKESIRQNTSEENYEKAIRDLIGIRVPENLELITTSDAPLDGGYNNLDLSLILNNTTLSQEKARNELLRWYQNNHQGSFIKTEYLLIRDDISEQIKITFVKLTIPNIYGEERIYFGIPSEEINFKNPVMKEELEGGFSIPITSNIEFYQIGESNPQSLGIFISPDISSLEEDRALEKEKPLLEKEELILLGLIGTFGFVFLLIILQEAYRISYEKKLFGNKSALIEIMNLIYNGRKMSLPNYVIQRNLTQYGWKNEQIYYAMDKMQGKRAFMLEVPLFNWTFPMIIKKKLRKFHNDPINITFIKVSELEKK